MHPHLYCVVCSIIQHTINTTKIDYVYIAAASRAQKNPAVAELKRTAGDLNRRSYGDPREPPHIHVTAGDQVAKFWFDPVELQSSKHLLAHKINHNQLCKLIEWHQTQFLEAWHAHFES